MSKGFTRYKTCLSDNRTSALLTYDAVSFLKYLDTIVAAHSPPPGSTRHNYSPWLFLDAAHALFQTAKSRVYQGKLTSDVIRSSLDSLSPALQPVLEEQPKWAVLAEVLEEIEQDAYLNPVPMDESNSTVLIMCSDQRTCRQLREYLASMYATVDKEADDSADGNGEAKPSARVMMRRKLREYLHWKISFSKASKNLFSKPNSDESSAGRNQGSSESQQGKAPPNKRRRVRGGGGGGGGGATSVPGRVPNSTVQTEVEQPGQVTGLLEEIKPTEVEEVQKEEVIVDDLDDMEDYYELYDMNDLVMVHPYDGDMDEHILEEARPRYIIMFDPDAAFIRRVEVYRSSHTGRNVRVYFLYYGGSVEEQRYLSAVRREKDSFTKLIREKSVRHHFGDEAAKMLLLIITYYRTWPSRSRMTEAPKTLRRPSFEP